MTMGSNMDPMTLMMLQSIMKGQQPQQQVQSQGVSGPMGQVTQAAPASAMGGISNALAPLQQMMLMKALKKHLDNQQQSPAPIIDMSTPAPSGAGYGPE